MDDEVKRVPWQKGFEALLDSDGSYRNDVFRDEFYDTVVDTMCAVDTGKWETAIQRGDSSFVVVEQYADRDLAKAGHSKWVESLKAEPSQELKELYLWEGI